MTIMLILMLNMVTVFAAENTKWVVDSPGVLSQETVDYVADLNENQYPDYKNKPQLSIVILNKLPENVSMDEYKRELFNNYGVGTKEENCGLLFVFSLFDREYGLEIGDGYARGSLLRNTLEKDFIDGDIKDLLKDERYDAATMQIIKYLDNIMSQEENGIYDKHEKALIEQEAAAQKQYEESMIETKATVIAGVKAIMVIVFIIALVYVSIYILRKNRYFEKVNAILYDYSKHTQFIKTYDENMKKEIIKYCWDNKDSYHVEPAQVMDYLYEKYFTQQVNEIKGKSLKFSSTCYIKYFKSTNNIYNFTSLNLLSIDAIICETDRLCTAREAMKRKNIEKIDLYTDNMVMRNSVISKQDLKDKMNNANYWNEESELSDKYIEESIKSILDKLEFDAAYDDFVKSNQSKIDSKYFNKSEFHNELRKSKMYDENRNGIFSDRNLLMLLLMTHMNDNQERIIRDDRLREESAERAERAQQERNSSNNDSFGSSFGSDFGGGSSSGGGMSGGW